jgi:hypothetical protein
MKDEENAECGLLISDYRLKIAGREGEMHKNKKSAWPPSWRSSLPLKWQ